MAREECGRAERADDQLLDILRPDADRLLCRGHGATAGAVTGDGGHQALAAQLVGHRQAPDDAVVAPDGLDVETQLLAQTRLDRQRPRRVDSCAKWRQQADAPVAQLVAEALHDDRPVARQGTRD